MGQVIEVRSFEELTRRIEKDLKNLEKRTIAAAKKAARRGVAVVKQAIPVAHGELRESVHAETSSKGAKLVVDAPHAAAVNMGSRPHTPPLGPLTEWVKLRGMQGLGSDRQISRLPGTTTARSARAVAGQLASMESGGALGVSAPEQVARAIQQAIAKHGTKPHHFIEKALPDLSKIFREELEGGVRARAEVADDGGVDAPGRTFQEGARGGVFFQGKHGKVWVNRAMASKLRSEGRVQKFKKT